tara:strand:- start:86585 stop:88159 length:1575 start_codon:yes stop_codon:yes gene_type:complete
MAFLIAPSLNADNPSKMRESNKKSSLVVVKFLGVFFSIFLMTGIASMVKGMQKSGWNEPFIAGCIFVVFGLLGWLFVIYLKTRISEYDELKKKYPEQPWMWRPEWAKGQGESMTSFMPWVYSVIAIALGGISYPLMEKNWDKVMELSSPHVFVIMAPAMGIIFAVYSLVLWLRVRKYGKTVCRLRSLPGLVGGRFEADIYVEEKFYGREKVKARLVCAHQYSSGSGKNRTTVRRELWSQEQEVRPQSANKGAIFPIEFLIPSDCKPTDVVDGNDQIRWEVYIHADVEGLDYLEYFHVPVFTSDLQEEEKVIQERSSSKYSAKLNQIDKSKIEELKETQTVQGHRQFIHHISKPGKFLAVNFGIVLVLFLFTTACGFAVYQINHMAGQDKMFSLLGAFFLVFSIPFALVGTSMGVAATTLFGHTIYQLLANKKVTLFPEGIVRTSTLFGIRNQTFFGWGDIEKVLVSEVMRSNGKAVIYAVKVKLKGKRWPRTVLGPFFDRTAAEWLLREVSPEKDVTYDAAANS